MVKFGRPELVCSMPASSLPQIEWGKYFFEGLASEMAQGRRYDADEEGFFEGIRFRLGAYEPNQNAPDLQLSGDVALVDVSWNRDAGPSLP